MGCRCGRGPQISICHAQRAKIGGWNRKKVQIFQNPGCWFRGSKLISEILGTSNVSPPLTKEVRPKMCWVGRATLDEPVQYQVLPHSRMCRGAYSLLIAQHLICTVPCWQETCTSTAWSEGVCTGVGLGRNSNKKFDVSSHRRRLVSFGGT